ncbi:Hypothetical protein HVR_LOCUS287 [uncultured virus]|nr:Hypothetical protein HVR_LOCUS287 [uncultured virus]
MCDKNNCNVCDKFKHYKCKQYNDLNPPNIAGKWDRNNIYGFIHENPQQKVSFRNIKHVDDDVVTINQCGVFIILKGEPNEDRPVVVERLGIWNPIRAGDGKIFSWQLIVVDNQDNYVSYMQPSKFDKNGNVIQLYASNAESGFSKGNPLQYPITSYYYMDLKI